MAARLSVIIPAYNAGVLLERTLESVLAQRSAAFEIIVIDDGSRDNTGEVASRFGHRGVKLISQPNSGQGAARNAGIRAAVGEYVVFVDADDIWFPWTLACVQNAIDASPVLRPGLISGTVYAFHVESELEPIREASYQSRRWPTLLHAMPTIPLIPTMATAVRTDLAQAAGGFLEERVNAEDVDFWLRLGDSPGFVQIQSPVLAGYRQTPGGLSCDMRRVRDGVVRLFERNAAGVYPGGSAMAANRRRFIAGHARPATLECIQRGDLLRAVDLYRRTLPYSLNSFASLKWSVGVPVWMLTRGLSARWRAKARSRRV